VGRKQDTNKTHRSEQTPHRDTAAVEGVVLARSTPADKFRRLVAYQCFGEEFPGLFLGDNGVPDVPTLPTDLEVCAMSARFKLRRSAPERDHDS
jgi:hypothetical protein